jgi:3-oxoadipate enol-lactonase
VLEGYLMVIELAHDVIGTGELDVVMLPALGAHRSIWRSVAEDPTMAGRRCVLMDLRGLGDSPVPRGPYSVGELAADVLRALDKLDIESADVVGVSLGGAVAQELAIEHPDRVRGLGLVSTLPRFASREAWIDRAAEVRHAGTSSLADGLAGKWVTEDFAGRHPDVLARLEAMVRATEPEGYAGNAEALAEWDSRDRLDSIRVSTLVVGGAADRSATPEAMEQLAVAIPNVRHVTIDGAAHLVPVERPSELARLLRDNLTSL